jgi:hypothetical protein
MTVLFLSTEQRDTAWTQQHRNVPCSKIDRALAMLGGLDGALRTQPVFQKLNLVGT